jgi:hypothetical protein
MKIGKMFSWKKMLMHTADESLFGSGTVLRNFSGKWRAQHHVIRGDVQATILRVASGDWTEV